jgi:hypothetical protein
MLWKNGSRVGIAMVAFGLIMVGCSDTQQQRNQMGPTGPSADRLGAISGNGTIDDSNRIYDQIEFLGNPLVSEVTIVKANHDAYNKTQPYNTATFRPQTEQFITGFGRPQALATTLGSVLYPDMLIVDTSKPSSSAGWLSWALANGYGGRKLTDDVVDVGLSAIFSTLLSNDPSAFCAPFQLPLCTDNVGANDKPFLAVFPYLASPT